MIISSDSPNFSIYYFKLYFAGNIFSSLILRPSKKKLGIDARLEKEKAFKFIEKFLLNPMDDC